MAFPGTFHRLVAPTYVGGLPASHDFINDPVANGFGGKAPAGALGHISDVAHPNEGSYFCGLSEDATSPMVNRPNMALAENTDVLDDLFHRDLAVPSEDNFVTAGATTDFTITGEVFVGSGVADAQLIRSGLIQLFDNSTGFPLTTVVGGVDTPVLVTAIEASLGGGTVVGSGWQVDPVISVFPAIPDATSVGAKFTLRGNPASQPEEMLTGLLRGAGFWEAQVASRLTNVAFLDFTFLGEKTFTDDVFFGPAAPATFDANAIFNAAAEFNDFARFFDGTRFSLPTGFADKEAINFGWDGSYNAETRAHIMQLDTAGNVGTHLYWNVSGGLEISVNAIWEEAGARWIALDLASDSQIYRFGSSGLIAEKLDVPNNAAPWADAAWSPNSSTTLTPGQQSFYQLLSQVPLLTSPSKASDDPVDTNAIWKLLWEYETGAAEAQKVRAYAGLGLTSGKFCITYNSRYDPATAPFSGGLDGSWISDSAVANGCRRFLIGDGIGGSNLSFALQQSSGDAAFPAADDEWSNYFAVDSFGNVEVSKARRYEYDDGGRVHTGHALNIYSAVEDTTLAAAQSSTMTHEINGLGITCTGGIGKLTIPILLPQDAILTQIRVQLEDPAQQVGTTGVEFNEHTRGSGTAGSITANQQVFAAYAGNFTTVTLSGAPFPVTIDNVGKQYFLTIQLDGVGGDVTLHDIRLDWTDPGPRND